MDIYVVELKNIDKIEPELLKNFQHKEFSNKDKLNEHCLTYLMLDKILENVYKIQDREIVFVNKKPQLKTGEKHFSLSHSGEYILLGFSDSNCGIDIEKIKQRDFAKIAKRKNLEYSSKDNFYEIWTLYEAKYKLSLPSRSEKTFRYEDYIISAVSDNVDEVFELYIQSPNNFSNS